MQEEESIQYNTVNVLVLSDEAEKAKRTLVQHDVHVRTGHDIGVQKHFSPWHQQT